MRHPWRTRVFATVLTAAALTPALLGSVAVSASPVNVLSQVTRSGTSAPALPRIWFVGDSLAVGMRAAFGQPGDVLTGFIGARSSQVIPDALHRLAQQPNTPRYAVVSLGTNNNRYALNTFSRDAQTFLNATQDRCVVWLTIHRGTPRGNWNTLNAILIGLAPHYPNLRLVDWNEYATFNGQSVSPDGIHPASNAYPRLQDVIANTFAGCAARTGN